MRLLQVVSLLALCFEVGECSTCMADLENFFNMTKETCLEHTIERAEKYNNFLKGALGSYKACEGVEFDQFSSVPTFGVNENESIVIFTKYLKNSTIDISFVHSTNITLPYKSPSISNVEKEMLLLYLKLNTNALSLPSNNTNLGLADLINHFKRHCTDDESFSFFVLFVCQAVNKEYYESFLGINRDNCREVILSNFLTIGRMSFVYPCAKVSPDDLKTPPTFTNQHQSSLITFMKYTRQNYFNLVYISSYNRTIFGYNYSPDPINDRFILYFKTTKMVTKALKQTSNLQNNQVLSYLNSLQSCEDEGISHIFALYDCQQSESAYTRFLNITHEKCPSKYQNFFGGKLSTLEACGKVIHEDISAEPILADAGNFSLIILTKSQNEEHFNLLFIKNNTKREVAYKSTRNLPHESMLFYFKTRNNLTIPFSGTSGITKTELVDYFKKLKLCGPDESDTFFVLTVCNTSSQPNETPFPTFIKTNCSSADSNFLRGVLRQYRPCEQVFYYLFDVSKTPTLRRDGAESLIVFMKMTERSNYELMYIKSLTKTLYEYKSPPMPDEGRQIMLLFVKVSSAVLVLPPQTINIRINDLHGYFSKLNLCTDKGNLNFFVLYSKSFISTTPFLKCPQLKQKYCYRTLSIKFENKLISCNSTVTLTSMPSTNPFLLPEQQMPGLLVMIEMLKNGNWRLLWIRSVGKVIDDYFHFERPNVTNKESTMMKCYYIENKVDISRFSIDFNANDVKPQDLYRRLECTRVIAILTFYLVSSFSTYAPMKTVTIHTNIFVIRTTEYLGEKITLVEGEHDTTRILFSIRTRRVVPFTQLKTTTERLTKETIYISLYDPFLERPIFSSFTNILASRLFGFSINIVCLSLVF